VHDATFAAQLRQVLNQFQIHEIYCPHPIVYQQLRRLQQEQQGEWSLINPPPETGMMASVQTLIDRGETVRRLVVALYGDESFPLKVSEIGGLLHLHDSIPGESTEDKIAGLMMAVAMAPEGDLIEVGALWGRSAALLAQLSQRFKRGSVLVIDPWRAAHSVQHDAPQLVQDSTFLYDWEKIFQGFLIYTSPFAQGKFNYLRMPSLEGAARYKAQPNIASPEYGTTSYAGKIALLHIDGNHDATAVAADVEAWLPHRAAGGWLILDDYQWHHGEGVKTTGDRLLTEHAGEIVLAFVLGKALFVKWR
jgi:hypothetical protein